MNNINLHPVTMAVVWDFLSSHYNWYPISCCCVGGFARMWGSWSELPAVSKLGLSWQFMALLYNLKQHFLIIWTKGAGWLEMFFQLVQQLWSGGQVEQLHFTGFRWISEAINSSSRPRENISLLFKDLRGVIEVDIIVWLKLMVDRKSTIWHIYSRLELIL